MSKNRSYSEKLKDPRWQKVRLEVLERAGWKCEGCAAADVTLFVHHGYYERGKEPWEYSADTLWSLCADCHELAETLRRGVHLKVGRLHPTMDMSPDAVHPFSSPGASRERVLGLYRLYRFRGQTLPLCAKLELPADRCDLVDLSEEAARRFADLAYTPEEVAAWFEQEGQRLLEKRNAIS